MNKIAKFSLKTATIAIITTLMSAGNAHSQGQVYVDAQIPVAVNVDAHVSITPPISIGGGIGDARQVTGGSEEIFNIKLVAQTVSVSHRPQRQAGTGARISHSRGGITVNLQSQQYQNAEISLYSVSGRRILNGKASASNGTLDISRSNVSAGVYLLSIKGTAGNTSSSKLTHRGGRMDINVAFDGGNLGGLRKSAEEAYYGEWTISVSAAGYVAQTRKFVPLDGINTPLEFTLNVGNDGSGTFIDGRDETVYRYVTIGEQVWMAENLNYRTPNGLSRCYGNDADDSDNSNCETYGRLYNWATVMDGASSSSSSPSDVRGICPDGWHVPSDAEWTTLASFVGSNAGTKLKAGNGWNSSGNGTDDFGFSALPGGYGWSGGFNYAGYGGYWWSATEGNASGAYTRYMYWDDGSVGKGNDSKARLYSLRCVRND